MLSFSAIVQEYAHGVVTLLPALDRPSAVDAGALVVRVLVRAWPVHPTRIGDL